MESKDFYYLRETLLNDALAITKAKGEDYTKGSKDVLRNFKETGGDLGIEATKVWGIFAKKHWDAITNFIKTGGQSESEPIRNRIIDLINYLCLLEGLIQEVDNLVRVNPDEQTPLVPSKSNKTLDDAFDESKDFCNSRKEIFFKFFDELDEPYRTQAKEYYDETFMPDSIPTNVKEAVDNGFDWSETPQVYNYWCNLYETL